MSPNCPVRGISGHEMFSISTCPSKFTLSHLHGPIISYIYIYIHTVHTHYLIYCWKWGSNSSFQTKSATILKLCRCSTTPELSIQKNALNISKYMTLHDSSRSVLTSGKAPWSLCTVSWSTWVSPLGKKFAVWEVFQLDGFHLRFSTGPTLWIINFSALVSASNCAFFGLLKNILLPWINGHGLLMNPGPTILNTPILWSQWCGNSLHPPWGSQFWGPGQGWWDVVEPSSTAGQGPKQRSFRHEEI